MDITQPLKTLKWIDRKLLSANDYNPNIVNKQNLELLKESILTNGWTMPIVVRPDNTIIDGFHRWTVSGLDPLYSQLNGLVPVVYVDHRADPSKNMYGTITHNRARGVHQLEPMKNIIKTLLNEGKTVKEICKSLGMKEEEVFRLSDISRDDFLEMMIKSNVYSKAKLYI